MKHHILFIDNDQHELDLFLNALRVVPTEDGFKCTHADSVIKAVGLLKKLIPHFIFINSAIPEKDIHLLLHEIKHSFHLRAVKIFLCACGDDADETVALQSGIKGRVQWSKSHDMLGERLTSCMA